MGPIHSPSASTIGSPKKDKKKGDKGKGRRRGKKCQGIICEYGEKTPSRPDSIKNHRNYRSNILESQGGVRPSPRGEKKTRKTHKSRMDKRLQLQAQKHVEEG